MLGMKSTTWAVSKKVGGWQTLAYTPMETNYEYVSRSDLMTLAVLAIRHGPSEVRPFGR